MAGQNDTRNDGKKGSGFVGFALKRLSIAIVLIIFVVWMFSIVPDILRPSGEPPRVRKTAPAHPPMETVGINQTVSEDAPSGDHQPGPSAADDSASLGHSGPEGRLETAVVDVSDAEQSPLARSNLTAHDDTEDAEHAPAQADLQEAAPKKDHAATAEDQAPATEESRPVMDSKIHKAPDAPAHVDVPMGVTFVEAVIKPMEFEMNERWWGWRPNDIVNLTDNVNHMQLGILEVTRRSAIQLSERISRTGTTDSFNRHLENAVNWLMVRPERYWFPSPESKYKESLEELRAYVQQLMKHQASFYIRPDNLIPLLSSFEELLGSCDENLVKQKNEDGSKVGFFQADDYFYYAKGVASAMATILEAVHHDFEPTLQGRHGTELLHHAIISCQRAAALSPLLITDGRLDSILANHRANIAAPISHARFFIGQLIKTLST